MNEEKLFYNNKEYILGATVSPKSGTGTMSYFLSNFNISNDYNLILISFKDEGISSNIVGPYFLSKPIAEYRAPINAFAWSWPNSWISYNNIIKSDNNKNLVAFSQNFNDNSFGVNGSWINSTNISNIASIVSGATAPDGTPSAFLLRGVTGNPNAYFSIKQTQKVKPGTTYTFSMYWDNIQGACGNGFRFRDVTKGYLAGEVGYDIEANMSTETNPGWGRYSYTLHTGNTQTSLEFYVLSRTVLPSEVASGVTFCIWGAQLEEGATATAYSRSYGYREWIGNSYSSNGTPLYEYNGNSWANYGPNNGITYVWPFVSLYGFQSVFINELRGWTFQNEIQRIINELKLLPPGKRALQPRIMNNEEWFLMVSDSVSATGAAPRNYFNNTYPFEVQSLSNRYPSPWTDFGLSAGKQFFTQVLDLFGSSGATFDYLFGDNESGFASNFSVGAVTGGITGYITDPRYYNEWRGISSIDSLMNFYGACGYKIFGPYPSQSNDKLSYVVWNNAMSRYGTYVLNEIFATPALQKYPNSIVSNYNSFISHDGITYAPPDPYGHPSWTSTFVGNAPSPVLYGDIQQIDNTQSPGNIKISNEDPSLLIIANPDYSGDFLDKGPWTSFLYCMQILRSAKRSTPNLPITPWVASVKDAGLISNFEEFVGPSIGFSDIKDGYNLYYGITFGKPGNSAYYYEMLRHTCLHGVKAVGYFNYASFTNPDGTTTDFRNYTVKGLTTHFKDLYIFNETLKEVNQKIGGFTLTTADTSRPSWKAPYFISGAPTMNGNTWCWRITTSPDYITTVNGSNVLSATGPGMWIETPGPVLNANIQFLKINEVKGNVINLNTQQSNSKDIILSWGFSGNSDQLEGFQIFRSSSPFAGLTLVPNDARGYVDSGLSTGVTYTYTVRGYNGFNTTPLSSARSKNILDLSFEPDYLTPGVPQNISAIPASTDTIKLAWDKITGPFFGEPDGYLIYMSLQSEKGYKVIANTTGATSYILTKLKEDRQYFFKIEAYNVGSNSGLSNAVGAKTFPGAPTGFTAIAGSTAHINLSWNSYTFSSPITSFYNLYTSTDNISFGLHTIINGTASQYIHSGLSYGQRYWYRLNSQNSGGTSEFSQTINLTPKIFPNKPTLFGLSIDNVGVIGATFNWFDQSNNETGFKLFYYKAT